MDYPEGIYISQKAMISLPPSGGRQGNYWEGTGMRTVSIINLKGGCAKTVTSINFACELNRGGSRVLLVDCDKQGNTSKFLKCHGYNTASLSDIMLGSAGIRDAAVRTMYGGLDVVPSNMSLLSADGQVMLDAAKPQQTRIRDALGKVRDDYTFCVIDCAPDINMSVINALVASDDVIIPVTIDEFAFDGLLEITRQVDDVKKYYNPGLNFAGCLVTQYRNDNFHNDGVETLRQMCGRVFDTKIKWSPMVSRSTFVREPVAVYSPRCGAARAYREFAAEYERGIAGNG